MREYTRHIAGVFDPVSMKQHCLLCGQHVMDYGGAILMDHSGQASIKGWQENKPVYISVGSPTISTSLEPEEPNTIVACL
jgi:hypothetical protein